MIYEVLQIELEETLSFPQCGMYVPVFFLSDNIADGVTVEIGLSMY